MRTLGQIMTELPEDRREQVYAFAAQLLEKYRAEKELLEADSECDICGIEAELLYCECSVCGCEYCLCSKCATTEFVCPACVENTCED